MNKIIISKYFWGGIGKGSLNSGEVHLQAVRESLFWASCTRIWVCAMPMIGLLKTPLSPIRIKGNRKRTSSNSLSLLGAQNKDLGASRH